MDNSEHRKKVIAAAKQKIDKICRESGLQIKSESVIITRNWFSKIIIKLVAAKVKTRIFLG